MFRHTFLTIVVLNQDSEDPPGPPSESCEENLRDLQYKGMQGTLIIQIDTFIYIETFTMDKLELTAWFEVNQTFGSGDFF